MATNGCWLAMRSGGWRPLTLPSVLKPMTKKAAANGNEHKHRCYTRMLSNDDDDDDGNDDDDKQWRPL